MTLFYLLQHRPSLDRLTWQSIRDSQCSQISWNTHDHHTT